MFFWINVLAPKTNISEPRLKTRCCSTKPDYLEPSICSPPLGARLPLVRTTLLVLRVSDFLDIYLVFQTRRRTYRLLSDPFQPNHFKHSAPEVHSEVLRIPASPQPCGVRPCSMFRTRKAMTCIGVRVPSDIPDCKVNAERRLEGVDNTVRHLLLQFGRRRCRARLRRLSTSCSCSVQILLGQPRIDGRS